MSEDEFGLLVASRKTSIPLRDVSVCAEIQGYVLGLKSVLTYVNDSTEPVEVLFRFPLEDSHAVVGLTAVIDGRKIKAEIREKEEARATYDDAIASGQSAALGEEKSGDVFSISLGNLPPQKSAEIHLHLVGELPIDAENMIRFPLPSTLKPRYTPAGSIDPLTSISGAPDTQVEHSTVSGVSGFQLSVLNASSQVADVTSPTHSLKIVRDSERDRVIATLVEGSSLDRDLVIQIEHKNVHQPSVFVERGKDGEGTLMSNQAVMVNFFPDFEQIKAACEFIFLIDRSGSMSGSFIKSARETAILFMKSLPENSRFNIFGFGSRFEVLFPESSVPYSQETLDRAMSHLQSLQADLGGTELLPPLEAIFKSPPSPGFSRQVFVLTDGSVSNTDRCIQKVKDFANLSRCFTFGIGSGASTSLVEGLARAGNGAAEFIKHGERMQPKVIRSLKRALQPSVTDVSVEFKAEGQQCKVLQSPQDLPPVYSGEKLVAYGLLAAKLPLKGTAILKGQMGEKKIEQYLSFEIQPTTLEEASLPTIHHLAGKALIKDWQSQKKSKEEIVKLSIDVSVISSHTAFIVVDEESSDVVTGAMKTHDILAAVPPTSHLDNLCQPTGSAILRGLSYSDSEEDDDDMEYMLACVDEVEEEILEEASIPLPKKLVAPLHKSAAMASSAYSDTLRSAMPANIDRALTRGEKLDDLEEKCVQLNSSSAAFTRTAKKSSGFSFGGFFSNLFGSKKSAPPQPAPSAASVSECFESSSYANSDDERCKSQAEVEEDFLAEANKPLPKKLVAPSRKSTAAASSAPSDTLTALINAQQANGSWFFESDLSTHFGKSLKELEDASPKDIATAVWATVLVLTLLKKRFSGQQEEWELIAMKANSWLKKQTLPSGISQEDLFKAADNVL